MRLLSIPFILAFIFVAIGSQGSGQMIVGSGAQPGGICGNNTNCNATSIPSLYPAMTPPVRPTAFPTGGNYPVDTWQTITPIAGGLEIGVVVDERCLIKNVVPNYGNATAPPTLLTIAISPSEELCTPSVNGSSPQLVFTGNVNGAMGGVPYSYTKVVVNGATINANDTTVNYFQYRLSRTAGQVVTASTCAAPPSCAPSNGYNYTFQILTQSVATSVANVALPYAPRTSFFGAFGGVAGGTGTPQFFLQNGAALHTPAPNAYPSPTSNHFGSNSLCDGINSSGYTLANGYPIDYYKLNDIVQAGVQITRTTVAPFTTDISHMTGTATDGRYSVNYADNDALHCALIRNNIIPQLEMEWGAVQYGPDSGGAGYSIQSTYETAADYGTFCHTYALHEHAYWPEVRRWSMVSNETNTDLTLTNGVKVAAYARACYLGIKTVDPTYQVGFGEINFDPAAQPLQFIDGLYANGFRLGYSADFWDWHISASMDPLAQYNILGATGYQAGDTSLITLIDTAKARAVADGETYPQYVGLGECCYYPTQQTAGMMGNIGDQAWEYSRNAQAMTRRSDVLYMMESDYDEDIEHTLAYNGNNAQDAASFGNIAFMDTTTNPSSPPSPRPVYLIAQAFHSQTGIAPSPWPTLAANSTPATPIPAPYVVQSPNVGTGSNTAYVGSSAPGNGHVVAVVRIGQHYAQDGVLDSNNVAYTVESPIESNSNGVYATVTDHVVAGSPTNTYTVTNGGGSVQIFYEIANVTSPGVYAGNSTTSAGTTFTATLANVAPLHPIICAMWDPGNLTTAFTISEGTTISDYNSNGYHAVHSFANTTGGATCTATFSATGEAPSMIFFTY